MSISKEIFGFERRDLNSVYSDLDDFGFNNALDLIDQYELSEEELMKVIVEYCNKKSLLYDGYKGLAKAIKQNQSKIFVRKNGTNNNMENAP